MNALRSLKQVRVENDLTLEKKLNPDPYVNKNRIRITRRLGRDPEHGSLITWLNDNQICAAIAYNISLNSICLTLNFVY